MGVFQIEHGERIAAYRHAIFVCGTHAALDKTTHGARAAVEEPLIHRHVPASQGINHAGTGADSQHTLAQRIKVGGGGGDADEFDALAQHVGSEFSR